MAPDLALPAPAKLNLGLGVIRRRADGYHDLSTVYQFIDLHDTLCFTRLEPGQGLQVEGSPAPSDEDLVRRASELFASRCELNLDLLIQVEKRIPSGGGLGGGSSDAATVLHGLNHLYSSALDDETLAKIGVQLGADVPVFIHGHAAYAEGVGDILTPCEPPTHTWLVLHPGVSISTAQMFAHPHLTLRGQAVKMSRLMHCRVNDFVSVARECYPEVDRAFRWLEQHASVHLSGTGSCLYIQTGGLQEAQKLLELVPPEWSAWACPGLNSSPLRAQLHAIGV